MLRAMTRWLPDWVMARSMRSEEHTSELQSHLNLVCRLLLEKKNIPHRIHHLPPEPPWSTHRPHLAVCALDHGAGLLRREYTRNEYHVVRCPRRSACALLAGE